MWRFTVQNCRGIVLGDLRGSRMSDSVWKSSLKYVFRQICHAHRPKDGQHPSSSRSPPSGRGGWSCLRPRWSRTPPGGHISRYRFVTGVNGYGRFHRRGCRPIGVNAQPLIVSSDLSAFRRYLSFLCNSSETIPLGAGPRIPMSPLTSDLYQTITSLRMLRIIYLELTCPLCKFTIKSSLRHGLHPSLDILYNRAEFTFQFRHI